MPDVPHPWQDPESKEINVDYCIVGGGLSGLYSAVRLAHVESGQEPPKICILEATHRVGGRVATIDIPGTSFYADLGAMRFLQTQPLVGSIVDYFGLETYIYDFPTKFHFVRGRRLDPKQNPDTAGAYHSLREGELKKDPGMLVIHAIAEALQEVRVTEPNVESTQIDLLEDASNVNQRLENCYDRVMEKGFLAFTPKEWRTIKLLGKYPTGAGLYLYQLGFWDVVQSRLSSEAYSFVDEGLGYQTIIGTWNAADAIPWFLADFSELPYKSIRGGMGEIPRRLLLAFHESMSRRRELNPWNPAWVVLQRARVKKVSWQENGETVVVNADLHDEEGLTEATRECTVRAKHCLVCVARGALKRIEFKATPRAGGDEFNLKDRNLLTPPFGTPATSEHAVAMEQRRSKLIGNIVNEYAGDLHSYTFDKWLLECVEKQPLLKMFLAFKRSWWTEKDEEPCQGFKVFTNLPLRQIFYHSSHSASRTDVTKERPEAETANGMIMAYCDAKHASYWDALAFQEKKRYASRSLEEAITKVEEIGGVRGNSARRDLGEFGVSRHLAERAHEQIWRVHRGLIKSEDLPQDMTKESAFARDEAGKREKIPCSETVLFMNWMKAPFYGGWHAWRIGVVSDDAKTIWERPWMDTNIYFAGEVVSSDQGWSEGALRSVERVLMHQLNMPAPRWEKRGARAEEMEQVDVEGRAKGLGFVGIKEYVGW